MIWGHSFSLSMHMLRRRKHFLKMVTARNGWMDGWMDGWLTNTGNARQIRGSDEKVMAGEAKRPGHVSGLLNAPNTLPLRPISNPRQCLA